MANSKWNEADSKGNEANSKWNEADYKGNDANSKGNEADSKDKFLFIFLVVNCYMVGNYLVFTLQFSTVFCRIQFELIQIEYIYTDI